MNYKELLSVIKSSVLPDKNDIYNSIIKPKRKKAPKWPFIAAGSVIGIGLILSAVYMSVMNLAINSTNQLPDEFKDISPVAAVIPSQTENDCITTETEFTVVTSDAVSKAELESILSVTPETEYTAKKINGNTFKISFADKLKKDTLYSISSMNGTSLVYSWAFQTDSDFKITDHTPQNNEFTECNFINIEFSHSDVSDFEQYFSIYPSIPGTFEHYGCSWKFIPSVEFDKYTAYTVTVSKGISNGNGKTLSGDYIFSFVPSNSRTHMLYSDSDLCDTFTTTQTPVASIYSEDFPGKQADITVYKIPDTDEYISLKKKYTDNEIVSVSLSNELANYVKFDNFTYTIQAEDKIISINYPGQYDTGYYISEIKTENGTYYHAFQVNNIAAYAMSYGNDYTLWVNDINTSSPAVAANVVCDDNSRLTDSNGIAQFTNCKSGGTRAYFTVKYNNSTPYIISVKNSDTAQNGSYIYLDKDVYSSSDTVNVYGFTDITSEEMALQCSWNEKQIDITPDETGAFIANIELTDNFCANESTVSLVCNNKELCSDTFTLAEYQNSEYNIDITTDKSSYFRTENIEYSIYVTHTDGSPAANTTVESDGDTFITDENGYASYAVKATYDDSYGKISNAAPSKLTTAFTVQSSDGGYTKKEHSTVVFDTDVMIDIDTSSEEDFNITLYATAPDKFTDGYYDYDNTNFFDSSVSMSSYASAYIDAEVTVEVYELLYKPDYNNAVYDSVTDKKIITYYNSETLVSSEKYTSQNGTLSVPSSIIPESGNYCIKVSADGQVYGTAYTKHYFCDSPESSGRYTLAEKNGITVMDCRYDSSVTGGVALLTVFTTDGIKTQTLDFTNADTVALSEYKAVSGVYFDGFEFYTLNTLTDKKEQNSIILTANPQNGNVELEITSSLADSCLNVSVSDSSDGYISSTEIEKHIGNGTVEISDSSSSYLPPLLQNSAETEDDISEVKETSNTVYFQNIKTDSNGKATLSFEAPSNERFLYITVQSVSENGVSSACKVIELSSEVQTGMASESTQYGIIDCEISDNTVIGKTQFTSDIYAHIYDEEMSFYYTVVKKLLEFEDSSYASVLSAALSDSFLKSGAIGILTPDNTEYLNRYLSGGTLETEYTDVESKAVLTAVANKYIDSGTYVDYFKSIINSNIVNEQVLSSYLALAALGEPILDDLNTISESRLNEKELMYLALAYAYAGDFASATEKFNLYIKDNLKLANEIAFYASETQQQTNGMTLLSILLTSKISPDYAKALVKYTVNNNSALSDSALYLTAYVKNYIPVSDSKATVQITDQNGAVTKTDLSHINLITVSHNDVDKISFRSISGTSRLLLYGLQ